MNILLSSRDEILNVDLNKVVYFLADGNFTRIVMDNKMVLTCGVGLGQMETIVARAMSREGQSFMLRAGKSHIVNVNKILKVSVLKQEVLLMGENGQLFNIKVSRETARGLKQLLSTPKQ